MRRFAKYLAITSIAVALLPAAGGWFMNRWAQSPAGRASIEAQLSSALRLPLKIASLDFSAWRGLTAKGITVSGPDGILFEAAGISASHRFFPLLRGSLALDEVRIEQPQFRLVEDAAGKWKLSQAPIAAPTAITEIPPPVISQPAATATPAPRKSSGISIGKITVQGGTAELIDKARRPFANITGLSITLRDVTDRGFAGDFAVERAILHGWFALENLSGTANRAGQDIQIRKLTATAGGGAVTGEATWSAVSQTASAALHLEGIGLARTTQDAGLTGQRISGTLSGDAQFAGLGSDKKGITGKGTLALKSGNCSQIEALRQIGDVLRLASLANFEIADATANFQVANEQVVLAPLDVSAPPVGITLTGPATFDGTLNLSGLLHAPADLVERQGIVAGKFSPADAQNRRSVPFNITGLLKKPKQNLAESLTGTKDRKQQRIIAAESIISALMQRNKPKAEQPAPPPQPVPAQP